MRVKMHIKYYGADKKELHQYAQIKERKFFSFSLRTCRQEIENDMGSYRLVDDDYGIELSSSEPITLSKGTTWNHNFAEYTWGYNQDIGVFLYNNGAIEI